MRVLAAHGTEADHLQQFTHSRSRFVGIGVAQPEGDIAGDSQMREQRVVLENHADAPPFGGNRDIGGAHHFAIQRNGAAEDRLKAGDAA